MIGSILRVFLGVLTVGLVTAVVDSLQTTYHPTFLFIYLPVLLVLAYLMGLWVGVIAAVAATALAVMVLPKYSPAVFQPIGALLFFLAALTVVLLADRYRRSEQFLRSELGRAERREQFEALLVRVSDVLGARVERSEVAQAVCSLCADAFGDAAAIVLLGPAATLELAGLAVKPAGRDLEGDEGLRATLKRLGRGRTPLVADALQATHPVLVNGPSPDLAGARVAVLAPLRVADEPLGFLAVLRQHGPVWDREALRAIEAVAERVALSAHRARLADQRRRRELHASFIGDMMLEFATQSQIDVLLERIVRRCTDVLGDWCGIAFVEPGNPLLVMRALHHRQEDRVTSLRSILATASLSRADLFGKSSLQEGKPLVISSDDAPTHEAIMNMPAYREAFGSLGKAIMHVPIYQGGEPIALLAAGLDSSRAWDEEDIRLASLIAERAGVAISNARLYEAEQWARAKAEDAERRQTFLAEASIALESSLDYQSTLKNIARLTVPRMAALCVVDIVEAGESQSSSSIRGMALAAFDPGKERVLAEMQDRFPPTGDSPHPAAQAIRSGKPVIFREVSEEDLAALTVGPEHLDLVRAIQPRSIIALPLIARGSTLGAITLIRGPSALPFESDDLSLAEELAYRAALAVDNARLYERERAARRLAEESAGRFESLNRLISLASSSFDLGAVFDDFGAVLNPLVPFVRVSVSLYAPEKDWLKMPYFSGPTMDVGPEMLEGPKAGTARGWVMDHGRPFIRRDTMEETQFTEDRILPTAGIRSYVIVPLTVGRKTIGTLNLGYSEPDFYNEGHAALLQPVADQLALTISRFQLFEEANRRAGELSETLQRALLPTELPRPPFAAISARYRAADPETKIGGDWYDAFLIADDSVMINIGDVAGHGTSAAAAMGQVRHVVRAYALEGASPAGILTAVNRFLNSMPDHLQMSIWLAEVDLLSGRIVYGGAGHPPVILVGKERIVDLPSTGPPLGILPDLGYADQIASLAPGERLIAYTDGLIEATRNVLEGEQRLKDAARATADLPTEQSVELLVRRTLENTQPHDDIAILVLDLLPVSAPLEFSVPASPNTLRRVRRAVGAYAERLGLASQRVKDIMAAVGEASLNVVEHAYSGGPGIISVRAERRRKTLQVTVADTGQWRTPMERGRGRGIRIMRGLADSFRSYTGLAGTVVEMAWNLQPREVPVEATTSPR